jgi:hypothetical protein
MIRMLSRYASIRISLISLVLVLVFSQTGFSSSSYDLSKGQVVYVPVYSNVFNSPKQVPFNLAVILSLRNTDLSNSITVVSADYYNTKGNLLKKYYQHSVTLAPLESTYIYIPEEDTAGGFGANFIVRWTSLKEVNAPIIECVMIGSRSGQGVSFVSPGKVIKEHSK